MNMDILFIGIGVACRQQMKFHFVHNMAQVHTHKHFQICTDISEQNSSLSIYTVHHLHSSCIWMHFHHVCERFAGHKNQRFTQKIYYCVSSSVESSILSTRSYSYIIVLWTYRGIGSV